MVDLVFSVNWLPNRFVFAHAIITIFITFPFFLFFFPFSSLQWHWKYSADATDTKSGKSGHSSDFSSKDGAAKQAAVALFQALGEGDCSCTVSTVPVGKCPIRFSVCFMFNNTGALHASIVIISISNIFLELWMSILR